MVRMPKNVAIMTAVGKEGAYDQLELQASGGMYPYGGSGAIVVQDGVADAARAGDCVDVVVAIVSKDKITSERQERKIELITTQVKLEIDEQKLCIWKSAMKAIFSLYH